MPKAELTIHVVTMYDDGDLYFAGIAASPAAAETLAQECVPGDGLTWKRVRNGVRAARSGPVDLRIEETELSRDGMSALFDSQIVTMAAEVLADAAAAREEQQ